MASPSSASTAAAAAAAEQSPQTEQLQDVGPPVETHDSNEGTHMLIPKEPYERNPDLLDPFLVNEDYLKALDEKHVRYDAEFSRHLMAKYFSGKAFNGGNVYDQETIIENETIKSSRHPFTSSFADPVGYYEEQNQSASPAEETSSAPGKKHPSKKSS